MLRLKFKATHLTCYHDTVDWYDGDEQDVTEQQAKHLLGDFPDNFSLVTKAEPVPENKAEPGPAENKDNGDQPRRRGRPYKVR